MRRAPTVIFDDRAVRAAVARDMLEDVDGEEFVRTLLLRLTSRERSIIGYRLAGFTLKAVGEKMGCSVERARSIERRGYGRLYRYLYLRSIRESW